LYALATRAKEAQERGTAAREKASAQLQTDVDAAEQKARVHAEELSSKMDETKGKVSDWWEDTQKHWNKSIKEAREHIEEKRAERDLNKAQKKADRAEKDASFAVEYAYAALDEAEYEVLDAILLRKYADELAVSGASQ
jgi:hypothetical protein